MKSICLLCKGVYGSYWLAEAISAHLEAFLGSFQGFVDVSVESYTCAQTFDLRGCHQRSCNKHGQPPSRHERIARHFDVLRLEESRTNHIPRKSDGEVVV